MIRVGLALVLGVALTAGAYVAAQNFDASVQQRVLEEEMQGMGRLAEERLRGLDVPIDSLGLFAERQEVNVNQWVPELKSRQSKAEQFRALMWLPVVKNRPQFEEEVQRYYRDFQVTEQTPEGTVQPAGIAAAWVPMLLIQPDHGNDVLRGLDIGNQPALAEAMQESYRRFAPALSPVFPFANLDEPAMLMLRYVPIPEGFAAGLITPTAMVEHVLKGRPAGIAARLKDEQSQVIVLTEPGFVEQGAYRYSAVVGGRTMTLDLSPTEAHQVAKTGLSTSVLLGGAGVTVLMVGLCLMGGKDAAA
jgi:hypothetical protein